MRKSLLALLIPLLLSACSHKERTLADLTPEQNAELERYVARKDDCLSQEAAHLDDGRSDIGQVSDLVFWKCQESFHQIQSLLYDKDKLSLGSTWSYKTKLEENSKKQITEALLTNRKLHAQGQEGQGSEMNTPSAVVPAIPVRMTTQQAEPGMHTEIMSSSMAPHAPRIYQQPQPATSRVQMPPEPPMPEFAPQSGQPFAASPSNVSGW